MQKSLLDTYFSNEIHILVLVIPLVKGYYDNSLIITINIAT